MDKNDHRPNILRRRRDTFACGESSPCPLLVPPSLMAKRPRRSPEVAPQTIRVPRYVAAPSHCNAVEEAPAPAPLAPGATPPTAILRVFDTWFQIPAALVPTMLAKLRSLFPLKEDGSPGDQLEVVATEAELHRLVARERRRHDAEMFRAPQDFLMTVSPKERFTAADFVPSLPEAASEPFAVTPEMFLAQGRAFLANERAAAEQQRIDAFNRAARLPAADGSEDAETPLAIARIPRRPRPPHLN